MAKALGNNPLLQKVEETNELSEKDIQTIIRERSDREQFVTASFRIRKTYLKKLRDYAYTNRLEQKEALDLILEEFLSKIDDSTLMEYLEKPRRKRG